MPSAYHASQQPNYFLEIVMALVSEVTSVLPSGLDHIDALLNDGPGWNWLTPARSILYYTFSVASGNQTGNGSISGDISAFNPAQQSACLSQLAYITELTGITFSAAGSWVRSRIQTLIYYTM